MSRQSELARIKERQAIRAAVEGPYRVKLQTEREWSGWPDFVARLDERVGEEEAS